MATTPQIKFESPAESLADSFASTPGSSYPPLFHDDMDASQVMTPQSYDDDSMFGSRSGSVAETPAPEKKPVKKRKSWGQQLPEPKTNLPPRYILDSMFTIVDQSANSLPRKRAKTEDEKEQRRVERVLRNRRAAQSSRERKRQEVEALEQEKRTIEQRNRDLELALREMQEKNSILQRELEQFTGGMTVFRGTSAAPSPAQSSEQVTLSQDLFGARDGDHQLPLSTQSIAESPKKVQTINPASLSPEIRPVPEYANASSSNLTQHPAAMLCDLQCQSEEQRPWMDSTKTTVISQLLAITMLISMTSEAISTLLSPLHQIFISLNTGSSLLPTPSVLTLIIWLATTTAPLTTSTSSTSSMTNSLRPRFSLRIHLLRRLLACNPNLARPLMDATMGQMRLLSEQQLVQACPSGADARPGSSSTSVEVLMTLVWVISVIEKEQSQKTTELDAATEVRQACMELEEMFRHRKVKAVRGLQYPLASDIGRHGGSMGQKSLDGWRTAFPHDRT
jgi:transcriptional activator HAC1